MISPKHLKEQIIEPVLQAMSAHDMRMATPEAVDLVLETIAQEMDMGFFLVQVTSEGNPVLDGGKGLGSMEESTYNWLVKDWLERPENQTLKAIYYSLVPAGAGAECLIGNHYASVFLIRLRYWVEPGAIPRQIEERAEYWDVNYNANDDHGTIEEYLDSYNQFIAGKI